MNTALKNHLLTFFQTQIQRLDQYAFDPIVAFEGKIILIRVQDLFSLCLKVAPQGFTLLDNAQEHLCDTIFSGPLSGFMASFFAKHPQPGRLDIKGDLALAKAFLAVWQQLDCDFEGYFARFVGDPVAYILSEIFTRTQASLKQTFTTRQEDLAVFLQDERDWLPNPDEVETLYTKIDTIRQDVDRLEARLQRLPQKSSVC